MVVIFGENESFDHYFGTYPNATNPAGEPHFDAAPNTPSVNGLNDTLLTNNPNSANPKRLDRSQAVTCSQNHGYSAEESAENGGLMNKFPEFTAERLLRVLDRSGRRRRHGLLRRQHRHRSVEPRAALRA